MLEKVEAKQWTTHLEQNNESASFQSGFRGNPSTETAFVRIANDILSSNDSGKVTAHALLDLSAAFDTIDHEILLNWLATDVGVTGTPYLGLGLIFLAELRLFPVQNNCHLLDLLLVGFLRDQFWDHYYFVSTPAH